ncbi:MAG: ATP-binding cassette domain-containing protein [Verrucomicrobiaceae bacterium]
MSVIRFVYGKSGVPKRLLLAAVVSALASTAVLAVVNRAAQEIAATGEDFVNLWWGLLFITSVTAYIFADGWLVGFMATGIENAIHIKRMRLVRTLADADLRNLEEFGQDQLYDNITQSCETISQNSQYIALSLRSVVLVVTILAYMALISIPAFLFVSGFLLVGAWIYLGMSKILDERQHRSMAQRSQLFEVVSDLFDGFKEQKLNSVYSENLNRTYGVLSATDLRATEDVQAQSWRQFVFGEMAFNLMIGVILFIVPAYTTSFAQDIVKLSAAVIFLAAPVFSLMQSVAVLRGAESAARRITELADTLETLKEGFPSISEDLQRCKFATVGMESISFSFGGVNDKSGFSVGPFTIGFEKGEIIFISGGNGSGKSTFVKLLTALYHPSAGVRLFNRTSISSELTVSYRKLIATVFADFYLLPDIYTSATIDAGEADALMELFEMGGISSIRNGGFTRRDLSTGQKKRLALVAALLENKPILVLDEWAADQDPHFRAKFYMEILPELKHRGLTVIAVTHDDHYMHLADRHFHMEEGSLVQVTIQGAQV